MCRSDQLATCHQLTCTHPVPGSRPGDVTMCACCTILAFPMPGYRERELPAGCRPDQPEVEEIK